MQRLTTQELDAIRSRLDKVTGEGFLPADGIFILDSDDQIIAECNNEGNAQFLGNSQHDVTRLLSEIDRLRELVIGIGMNESSYEFIELNENYFEIQTQYEKACVEYTSRYMEENGIKFCEDCHGTFSVITSPSSDHCADCANDKDMEKFGWEDYTVDTPD